MGMILTLFFMCFPIAEIWVIQRVAARIGFLDTLILIILSAVFGVYLAKAQGMAVLGRIQQCLAQGRMPAKEMVDGILIFIGAVLFIIPGFITDLLGLILVFPVTRWLIRSIIVARSQAGGPASRGASARPSSGPRENGTSRQEGLSKDNAEDAQIVE